MTKPTIHLNGDSANTLTEGYEDAYRAVNVALEAIQNASPNGRNYYPQGDTATAEAINEHVARVRALTTVANELLELAIHCADARDARKARAA